MRVDPGGAWIDQQILEIAPRRRPGAAPVSVLAIDAGTTGVTALVVTPDGRIAAKGYQEFAQHFPQPGWVEHAPEEIWQATLEATRAVLDGVRRRRRCGRSASPTSARRSCSGTARPSARRGARSSGRTGVPPTICDRLRDEGHEERVTELTGLRLDPYFSGTKLTWLAEHEPHTWALVEEGRYAVGTVDSYLVARMTRGTWHVTDVSNACRTLLFDLVDRATGPTSCARCSAYPATRCPSWCPTGARSRPPTRRRSCGLELPIAGIAGDQQSALFGQTCFDAGDAKCTYGTGLVHPHQHRHRRWSAPTPGCCRPRPGARPTAS